MDKHEDRSLLTFIDLYLQCIDGTIQQFPMIFYLFTSMTLWWSNANFPISRSKNISFNYRDRLLFIDCYRIVSVVHLQSKYHLTYLSSLSLLFDTKFMPLFLEHVIVTSQIITNWNRIDKMHNMLMEYHGQYFNQSPSPCYAKDDTPHVVAETCNQNKLC